MKEKYLVAPNRTEAVLLFGRNMPSDCCDPQVKEELVSIDEFLKEKRML
jgi:hypothetical protein